MTKSTRRLARSRIECLTVRVSRKIDPPCSNTVWQIRSISSPRRYRIFGEQRGQNHVEPQHRTPARHAPASPSWRTSIGLTVPSCSVMARLAQPLMPVFGNTNRPNRVASRSFDARRARLSIRVSPTLYRRRALGAGVVRHLSVVRTKPVGEHHPVVGQDLLWHAMSAHRRCERVTHRPSRRPDNHRG